DDAVTMVVSGLSGRISSSRDDLVRAGLHRSAVINIEPLYASYAVLTVPHSMYTEVEPVLEKLHIDVVRPEEVRAENLPGLTADGIEWLKKMTSWCIDLHMAANISQQ
ncbi:hypothetical protein LPJ61_005668, partial [Coemansia biformis]